MKVGVVPGAPWGGNWGCGGGSLMLEGEGSKKACFRSEGDDYTKVLRATTSRSQQESLEEGEGFSAPDGQQRPGRLVILVMRKYKLLAALSLTSVQISHV